MHDPGSSTERVYIPEGGGGLHMNAAATPEIATQWTALRLQSGDGNVGMHIQLPPHIYASGVGAPVAGAGALTIYPVCTTRSVHSVAEHRPSAHFSRYYSAHSILLSIGGIGQFCSLSPVSDRSHEHITPIHTQHAQCDTN